MRIRDSDRPAFVAEAKRWSRPELQERARGEAETMRWRLSRAEAAEQEAQDG
ncbi:hypothetical protein [Streptomyces virginiae]|uniref:hypothetical protein n=1 Tax=Streptomyces virginiae TaxID=1961 RepID=UPI00363DAC76